MPVEGLTEISVAASGEGGPATASSEVPFWNPAMAWTRDLSIALVQFEAKRKGRDIEFADALCGAGTRALRIANEANCDVHVYANDLRTDAIAELDAGAARLAIADKITGSVSDAHQFMASRRFDIVDIDPYGSPAPFLDSGVRATRHGGLLCTSATDTGALSGRFPRVCRRRYGSEHFLQGTPWYAEIGLRILAGAVIRAAARHEKAAQPVLSLTHGHCMRVAFRMTDGRQAADKLLKQLNFVDRTGNIGRQPASDRFAGPLWTGDLHESSLAASLAELAAMPFAHDRTFWRRVGPVLPAEAEAPPLWIDLDDFGRDHGQDTPRTGAAIESLQAAGVTVARSHISPKGLKVTSPDEVARVLWPSAARSSDASA